MNDFAQNPNNIPHRTELSSNLLESVEEILREPIEEKDIAGVLDRVRQAAHTTSPRRSRLSRRVIIVAAIATTSAGVALFILPNWRPVASVTWAEVVEAVAKKSWLHYITTWNDGGKDEGWFSEKLAVNGCHYTPAKPDHAPEHYTWIDYTKELELYYYPETNSIISGTAQKIRWEHNMFFMKALLSGNLEAANRSGQYEICDQRQRTITEDGKRCIEYRFRWRDIENEAQSVTQFVAFVDPETRLPFRLDMIDPSNEKVEVREQYDYPDSGPTDIYALGTSKTAKIIDCTLSPEVEQLAKATVAAGRREDMQFSALIVRRTPEAHWAYRVWKKGLRWRVESSINPLDRSSDNLPTKIIDTAKRWEINIESRIKSLVQGWDNLSSRDIASAEWWKHKAEKAQFAPTSLFDGKWHWQYSRETRHPNQAEIDAGMDKDDQILVSNKKEKLLPWIHDRYWLAEPLCYMGHPTNIHELPPDGLPVYGDGSSSPYYLTQINHEPKDGPPNTVFLNLINPIWKMGDSNGQHIRVRQVISFTIDPLRDYLIMRWCAVAIAATELNEEIVKQPPAEAELTANLASKESKGEIMRGAVIQKLTQDPQKHWLPSVVGTFQRCKAPDKSEAEILQFFYDFDTPIPDSVFEP